MSRWRTGVTAAAVLPSALGAALLVSAPFAGTTTAPLANSHTAHHVAAQGALGVPVRAVATFAGAELLLVGAGVGVILVARNRSRATQPA